MIHLLVGADSHNEANSVVVGCSDSGLTLLPV